MRQIKITHSTGICIYVAGKKSAKKTIMLGLFFYIVSLQSKGEFLTPIC